MRLDDGLLGRFLADRLLPRQQAGHPIAKISILMAKAGRLPLWTIAVASSTQTASTKQAWPREQMTCDWLTSVYVCTGERSLCVFSRGV